MTGIETGGVLEGDAWLVIEVEIRCVVDAGGVVKRVLPDPQQRTRLQTRH